MGVAEKHDDSPVADPPVADPPAAESGDPAAPRLPAALLASFVAIPIAVLVLVFVLVAGRSKESDEPTDRLAGIDAPAAESAECASLLAALSPTIDEFTRNESVTVPGYATWSSSVGELELRCGVPARPDLTATSPLQLVNSVSWFTDTEARSGLTDDAATGADWFSVDHRPYVQIWLPDGSGSAPILAISDAIAAQLPTGPLEYGPK